MNKEIVNLQVINGLKSKGYNVDDMDFNLLNDFADIMYKAINVMHSSLQLKDKVLMTFGAWRKSKGFTYHFGGSYKNIHGELVHVSDLEKMYKQYKTL